MAEAAVPAAAGGVLPDGRPLDEVMLAMDVVDTLRHADRLVERELASDQRDAQLKQRLRDIYKSQGLEVTDRILDEGVAALKEERFVYKPPEPGLARSLALIWVERGRWGRWLGYGLGALLLVWGFRWVAFDLPAQQKAEAAARELVYLPKELDTEVQRIAAVAQDPDVLPQARKLAEEGHAAAKAGDIAAARAKAAELKSIRENLDQTYELRIVSRPGERSGVYRIPSVNSRARNYYVIVEAIGPNGKAMSFPVYSEEDGRTENASRWGIRVDQAVYDKVRADKLDDGIIQNNKFGVKRKGYLTPDYVYPVQGGTILEW